MPPVGPIKRREFVAALRSSGYQGPFSGKRHQFMRRAERTVRLPNPHRGEISRGLLVLQPARGRHLGVDDERNRVGGQDGVGRAAETGPVDSGSSHESDARDCDRGTASENGAIPAEPSHLVPGHRSFRGRLLGALRCEPGAFEEIAADPSATRQALIVFGLEVLVSLVSQATTLGLNSWRTLPVLLSTLFAAVPIWPVRAAICTVVSGWLSANSPSFPHWLRAIGFAHAPAFLGVIPVIGGWVGSGYVLILQVVAVKRLAGVPTGRAIVVGLAVLIGPAVFSFLIFAFMLWFIGSVIWIGLGHLPW